MREVETAREALDATEQNLERFRWIITHPREAALVLVVSCAVREPEVPTMEEVCRALDKARA